MDVSAGGTRGLRRTAALAVLTATAALLAPTASASTTDPGLPNPCRYRSGFAGSYYCLGVVEDVSSTKSGTGKRVYLSPATVTSVTADTVTVAQLRDDCHYAPGVFCGASLYEVYLTVRWSGTHRPPYAAVVRLYGTTTTGSLTPAGYVRTGTCDIVYDAC